MPGKGSSRRSSTWFRTHSLEFNMRFDPLGVWGRRCRSQIVAFRHGGLGFASFFSGLASVRGSSFCKQDKICAHEDSLRVRWIAARLQSSSVRLKTRGFLSPAGKVKARRLRANRSLEEGICLREGVRGSNCACPQGRPLHTYPLLQIRVGGGTK